MLPFLQRFVGSNVKETADHLLYAEVKKNLETYYMMFQLGKYRLFSLQAFEAVAAGPGVVLDEDVVYYGRRIMEYNQAAKEYRDYKDWYSEDVNRKTRENAGVLHEKKQIAQEKFEGLEDIILAAKKAFQLQGC
ncbi:MAG: hypothetical protein KAJ18_07955 [Candidatus Omnitrophica bacterium]|nr:hypothetical protein [Candidatus Omnitrophota bacterium]